MLKEEYKQGSEQNTDRKERIDCKYEHGTEKALKAYQLKQTPRRTELRRTVYYGKEEKRD